MPTRRPTRKKKQETVTATATDWALIHALMACDLVRTVYLWGPPGIGKTYAAYHYGRLDNGMCPVTLTQDTPASELRGHFIPKGKEFVWHDGPFTAAMRAGARLVINELTHAGPDVQALLYPVLESVETAQLMLPSNETVRPQERFHVICTDNEPPDELPEALRDRFDSIIQITEPHPDALALLDEPLRRAAVRCNGLKEDRRVSLRGWLKVNQLQHSFGLKDACAVVFGADRGNKIHEAVRLAEA
ncbi:MAG: AAA family ATPase [Planctomycetota bacterium]|jgi:MoxR-like ATPase